MANISDDERLEVDLILEQRKRKGLLEYLVRWKGSGDDVRDETWEPVKKIAVDYAQAIQNFTKSLKIKKAKRSTSRSRKTTRSRSRSSSRSLKAASGKEKARSRSRGRQQKVNAEKVEISEGESSRPTRSSTTKAKIVTSSTSVIKAASEPIQVGNSAVSHSAGSNTEAKAESQEVDPSIMKTWQQLEVQRVHNEQRPVREDDLKPRSAIWKVADYAVIVLFILSLIAALFLFLEKFINLDEFKKQAFPNMSVLQARLDSIQNNLFEVAHAGVHRLSDAWLYLIEQVKGAEEVNVKTSGS